MASAWLTRMAVVPLSRIAVVAVTFAVMPPTATLSSPTVQYLRRGMFVSGHRHPKALPHSHTRTRPKTFSGAAFHDPAGNAQQAVPQTHTALLPPYITPIHYDATQGTPGIEAVGTPCETSKGGAQPLSLWDTTADRVAKTAKGQSPVLAVLATSRSSIISCRRDNRHWRCA